jgi:phosphoglycolate phosphatase
MTQAVLILFDIDGTLTRSHNGYLPFNEAFEKTFGFPGDIRTVVPDGNTDPLIVGEIFAGAGRAPSAADGWRERFAANLRASYARAIGEGKMTVRALPGAIELVRALAEVPELYQGIVTGNFEGTARLKLEAAGLDGYLPLGAYGSDAADRVELPRIARRRWEERAGVSFVPERCVIVGDTPKDLAAARENRMRCILVATGRYAEEELRARAPDACLPNFTAAGDAVATLHRLLEFA